MHEAGWGPCGGGWGRGGGSSEGAGAFHRVLSEEAPPPDGEHMQALLPEFKRIVCFRLNWRATNSCKLSRETANLHTPVEGESVLVYRLKGYVNSKTSSEKMAHLIPFAPEDDARQTRITFQNIAKKFLGLLSLRKINVCRFIFTHSMNFY